ncbi:PREDICTED: 2-5A-dependent ribonuclease [Tinamus guttatus]|uniref:2-5A-dependent ribonuclease n=1 Tax=Tinamus guttatus TaxID=94827 RepID=UPI00052F3A8D|nr:PREDICTED: 2-5A-dependent ribonuclease [Tinamus guttatus]
MEHTSRSQLMALPTSSSKTLEDLDAKLHTAVKNNEMENVKELLEKGANVNSRAEAGWTPLQSAVHMDEDMALFLLEKGADLHARKDNGGTAFIEAGAAGSVRLLEVFLAHGSDINEYDNNGFTAFMEAAWYGKEEALRFLHGRGADVNMGRIVCEEKRKLNKGGATALMDACKEGHMSVVKALVQDMNVDLNICDNQDRNALIHALKEGSSHKKPEISVSIGLFLLDRGIDVKSRDENGKTALILAAEVDSLDLVKALLEKGEVDIDDADNKGNTALVVAVTNNNYSIAELLCEKGARTDIGDLIDIVNRKRASDLRKLLLKHKAKFVPKPPTDWEPTSKRWRDQLKKLYEIYRPMIGKLKIFQYIYYKILKTSLRSIYLGLYGDTEVAVGIGHHSDTEFDEQKRFLEQCGHCKHLVKLFQHEKAKGLVYLCFPLWERNLEEYFQASKDGLGCKDILRMIFQAVRELHSLGFAHQDLHPSKFLIDLNGNIYLEDFANRRKLIEGKKELVNTDLEALSRLVLYVITKGKKPFEQISPEDVDADSPDYEEALDLVESLALHDERGLENLIKHPFFWSKRSRFDFLKAIWKEVKFVTIFKDLKSPKCPDYQQWTRKINPKVLKIMQNPEGRTYIYRNGVKNLLRFIRNLDEHLHESISEIIGDHVDYFSKLFPALTIDVYNYLRKHPEFHHLANIQDPFLP